jgi:hypothetical protein
MAYLSQSVNKEVSFVGSFSLYASTKMFFVRLRRRHLVRLDDCECRCRVFLLGLKSEFERDPYLVIAGDASYVIGYTVWNIEEPEALQFLSENSPLLVESSSSNAEPFRDTFQIFTSRLPINQ